MAEDTQLKISNYVFLISLLFVMAVFLPVNYFSFLNFDDVDVVNRIHEKFYNIQWFRLFFRSHTTTYYRPLLEIICYADYALWGLSISAWHLTNYVFHILNAAFVYFIARNLLYSGSKNGIWAVLAMLLFALNPMACESVAWISGRSDLAGTFFSLLAVWLYTTKSASRYLTCPLAILAGLLCKENALSVVPIIILLEAVQNFRNKANFKILLKKCSIWGSIVLIPLLVYFFLRTNGFEHYFYDSSKRLVPPAAKSAQKMVSSIYDKDLWFLFPATAFYLKKLIIPFPLNFAIEKINTLFYSLAFIFIIVINSYSILKKRWDFPVLTIFLVMSFSPALIVALGNISWVPMAERYLYLSLSVMAVGLSYLFKHFYKKTIISKKYIITICCILIALLSVSTYHRLFAFKDNKTIWAATLKTNPNSSMVLFLYGSTVEGRERYDSYKKAVLNPESFPWRAKVLLELGKHEMGEGNHEKALNYIEEGLDFKATYQNLCSAAGIVLSGITGQEEAEKKRLIQIAADYFGEAYTREKTAFALYRQAGLLNQIENTDQANLLFQKVIQKYPNSEYAGYAKKHLSK